MCPCPHALAGGGRTAPGRPVLREEARRRTRPAGRHALHRRGQPAPRAATAAERARLEEGTQGRPGPSPRPSAGGAGGLPRCAGSGRHPAAPPCRGTARLLHLGRLRSSALTRHRARIRPAGGQLARGRGETVLCWGDVRIGNIVFDGFAPTAVTAPTGGADAPGPAVTSGAGPDQRCRCDGPGPRVNRCVRPAGCRPGRWPRGLRPPGSGRLLDGRRLSAARAPARAARAASPDPRRGRRAACASPTPRAA